MVKFTAFKAYLELSREVKRLAAANPLDMSLTHLSHLVDDYDEMIND